MKTEAQKRAQKTFMEKGTWKQIQIMMRIEDADLLKQLAKEKDVPVSAYVKDAMTAYSGKKFSWDE